MSPLSLIPWALMIAAAGIAAAPNTAGNARCAANEVFVRATMSELTCQDRIAKPIKPVTECRCQQGLVRYQKSCIKPVACTMICKDPNEAYILTSMTEPTCERRFTRRINEVRQCRCKPGFIRFEKRCIRPENCPPNPCRDPNEEYVFVSFTEPTCSAELIKGIRPSKQCRCRNGFVRSGSKCIPKGSCPATCTRPNEEYILATHTEPTCGDGSTSPLQNPSMQCRCRDDFVRHKGRCVSRTECPDSCKDPNEIYTLTKMAEPTCDTPITYTIKPVRACRCTNGFIRSKTGKCISVDECPKKCPGANEYFVITRFTEPTCTQLIPKDMKTMKFGCRCNNQFVRSAGRCISRNQCPKSK